MSIHDGHRKRIKDRFLREGLSGFEEVNVLELLLFYCVPQRDTNEIAHNLLKHFGSIVKVFEAKPEELEKVEGVNKGISTFLSLRGAAERYYRDKKAMIGIKHLNTTELRARFLAEKFSEERNEKVYILCLDAASTLLDCREIGEGSINSASVPVRRIVEIALATHASQVVLAHNHPGGIAFPSPDDVSTTIRLAEALQTVDVELLDHLLFANDDCISFVDSGYYSRQNKILWNVREEQQ